MRRQRLTITLRTDILKKLDQTIDGQNIRNRSHAIESILEKQLRDKIFSTAIILGGTQANVFKEKTLNKLLLPVGEKTLVEKNILYLKQFGITDIIIATGQWEEDIKQVLGTGEQLGITVRYFKGERGTGSVLADARKYLKETFLVMNGDITFTDLDIEDMYRFHKAHHASGTLLLAGEKDPSPLGSIFVQGNQIIAFHEKPEEESKKSYIASVGVYLLEPSVAEMVADDHVMFEHHIFPKLAKQGTLYGYHLAGKWHHLHDEKRYSDYLTMIKEQ